MLSIKRSLIGLVKHVFYDDPALGKDHESYSYEKFVETGDVAHLQATGDLTVFHLKPLSMKRLQRITSMKPLDGNWTTEQFGECVAYGLKSVENMEVDGKKVELQFDDASGEQRIKNKSLESIYNQILFNSIGSRVLEISDLLF